MTYRSSPVPDRLRLPAALRPRSTAARCALTGVLATALVGGIAGTAAFDTSSTVTLAVDGVERTVETDGETVRDVVEDAGLEVGEHDVLAPSAGTLVQDGDRVALRRARPLTLVVDGRERTAWTTAGSVQEALNAVGLRSRTAKVSASRSRRVPLSGMRVAVETPKDVTLRADERVRPLVSTGPTVRDALVQAGIKLGPEDQLSPARATRLRDGMTVRITRVRTEQVVQRREIPAGTERREDDDLTAGNTRVVRDGEPGVLRRTSRVKYVNGEEISRSVLSEQRVRAPRARVVVVGTKPKPEPAPVERAPERTAGSGTASSDGLNWAALARCESGGNPGAVNASGKYRGMYQFDYQTWSSVGGSGDPADASAAEQTRRAQALYAQRGRAPWPKCGRLL